MAEQTETKKSGAAWGWRVAYAALFLVLVVLMFVFEDWAMRAGVALVGVVTVIRLALADREKEELSRGVCRYCGCPVTVADRECPKCERTVPKEQRMGQRGR